VGVEPAPDPRWEGSEPRLVMLIRDEILAAPGQRITFARFMQRALTEPGLGYYATSQLRPTREGDFLTAPELHPFFGRCLSRFVAGAWQRAGSAGRFVVREHGAGRGALRDAVLAGLTADGSPLAGLIEWRLVDLPSQNAPLDGPADLVVANEFLDALPVHRLRQDGELREAWVCWRDGWFAEVLAAPSDAALAATLTMAGVTLREGQRAEVCLAASDWIAQAAAGLGEGGELLVIDYGSEATELFGPRHMAGSLLTYRRHTLADDPFSAVGHSDITAHVDLTTLRRAAAEAGLTPLGATTQARFLVALGLGDLLADLGREATTDLDTYVQARAAVARLLDPRHLGAFAVLAWGRVAHAGDAQHREDAAFDGLAVSTLPGFVGPT
jgi:SAM-dependent MidA family methyltransferase